MCVGPALLHLTCPNCRSICYSNDRRAAAHSQAVAAHTVVRLLRGCDSHLQLANSVAVPFKRVGCECRILSCLSERVEGGNIPTRPTECVCACVSVLDHVSAMVVPDLRLESIAKEVPSAGAGFAAVSCCTH